jgi:hypothetical protein
VTTRIDIEGPLVYAVSYIECPLLYAVSYIEGPLVYAVSYIEGPLIFFFLKQISPSPTNFLYILITSMPGIYNRLWTCKEV